MTYIPGGSEPRREPLGQPAYMPPVMHGPPYPPPAPVDRPESVSPPAYARWTPAPAPKKRRTGLIVGLALAAVLLLAGGTVLALGLTGHSPVSIPGVSQGFQVRGVLTVAGCDSPGYDDIQAGAEVTITDESGKVLAVGRLSGGAAHCNYPFVIDNVPPGEKFYGVTVSHRGTLHYTEAQMRQGLELSLG